MEAVARRLEDEDHITTVVTRTVRPGNEQAYENWLHRVGQTAHRYAGHQGIDVLRPRTPGGRDYVLIFRFDTLEHLDAWNASDERNALVAEANELCEGTPEVQRLTGMEGWFTLPGAPVVKPPTRWRMAVVTWLAAFPLIQILSRVLLPLLDWAPPIVRGAALGAAMVILMTYVVMPRFTWLFKGFLFPKR